MHTFRELEPAMANTNGYTILHNTTYPFQNRLCFMAKNVKDVCTSPVGSTCTKYLFDTRLLYRPILKQHIRRWEQTTQTAYKHSRTMTTLLSGDGIAWCVSQCITYIMIRGTPRLSRWWVLFLLHTVSSTYRCLPREISNSQILGNLIYINRLSFENLSISLDLRISSHKSWLIECPGAYCVPPSR